MDNTNGKVHLTAQEIHDRLVNEEKIQSSVGHISFNLCNYQIIVTTKDPVGVIIEDWVKKWLEHNNIEFSPNPNTQTKPDVYLNPEDYTTGLMEIKAFDYQKGPGFDIADFKGFATELLSRPYLLDIDCLVFSYIMDEESGEVVVNNVWLRKIWNIACSSDIWPLKVQASKDRSQIKKVRPATWYSKKTKFKPFESEIDFLSAYEQTLFDFGVTRASFASQWKYQFPRSYKNYYGKDIIIPRWDDIKEKYL